MELLKLDKTNKNTIIARTIDVLRAGGIVVFPSDTVYGFLADASDEQAVEKLIRFKNRPWGKPISVFVSDFGMLKRYAVVTGSQERLLSEILPGPFTVILGSRSKTSRRLESESRTLGLRLPDYELINRLAKQYGKPFTATSANLSGRAPHYSVGSFLRSLPESKKKLIDLVIDGGVLPRNKPSTIIDLSADELQIIRKGDIVMKNSKTFETGSEKQTRQTGAYIANYVLKKSKTPLVMILEGELGAGKTVFVKGVGDALGIRDIVSPTFVIYYEYDAHALSVQRLYHFDLYRIKEQEEFDHLGIESMLHKRAVLCFEWGEKAARLLPLLKKKAAIVHVRMLYIGKEKRKIVISMHKKTTK